MGFFTLLKQRPVGGVCGSRICLFCFCGIIPAIALVHTRQNLTFSHYFMLLGFAELSHVLLQGANVFDLIPQPLQLCKSKISFGKGMLSCMSKA